MSQCNKLNNILLEILNSISSSKADKKNNKLTDIKQIAKELISNNGQDYSEIINKIKELENATAPEIKIYKKNSDRLSKAAKSGKLDLSTIDGFDEIPNSDATINTSGGARGADALFDIIGSKYGNDIKNNHITARYGNSKGDKSYLAGLLKGKYGAVMSDELYRENVEFYSNVFENQYPLEQSKATYPQRLQVRNVSQVRKSDTIFAISELTDDKTSGSGGTNTAIEIAKASNRDIYVLNPTDLSWYKFNYNKRKFEQTKDDKVKITKGMKFAGIGARKLEIYDNKDEETNEWVPAPHYDQETIDKVSDKIHKLFADYYKTDIKKEIKPDTELLEKLGKIDFSGAFDDMDNSSKFWKNEIVAQRASNEGRGKPYNYSNPFALALGKNIQANLTKLPYIKINTKDNGMATEIFYNWLMSDKSSKEFIENGKYKGIIPSQTDEKYKILDKKRQHIGKNITEVMPKDDNGNAIIDETVSYRGTGRNDKYSHLQALVLYTDHMEGIDTSIINIWYGSNENSQLSNLAKREFMYNGKKYYSVEHAYQTLKSGKFDSDIYSKYNKSAGIKIAGKKGTDKDNSYKLMTELIKASVEQNNDIKKLLVDTYPNKITHNQDNGYWKTAFPSILMNLRNEYIKNDNIEEHNKNIEQMIFDINSASARLLENIDNDKNFSDGC
jgi:predicted NAD-dependent protein-ADP-ribosyltransferase YbiA (DUF1768 family)